MKPEQLSPLSHVAVITTYLKRTFDPVEGLEQTVVRNRHFPLARAIMLGIEFDKLPKPLMFGPDHPVGTLEILA